MNAYDAVLGNSQRVSGPEILGNLEILGDAAMSVATEADKDIVRYTQAGFKASDKIHFGIGNNVLLPAATNGFVVQQPVQTPFKPLVLTFPSQYCPDILIQQIQIGSVLLIEGAPVCMEVWSEVSRNNRVSWPTLDTSQSLIITLSNVGAVDVRVNIAAWGIRLRK
jgi:hypothetical protein